MIAFEGLPLWIYALVGIAILWGKMKRSQRSVYALTELTSEIVPNQKIRILIELAIFSSVGTIVAMGIISPNTPAQAFAAGLGWTSLTTK